MEQSSEAKFKSLRTFNAAMGVLHLVQGVLMLAVSNKFTLPIKKHDLREFRIVGK